MLVKANTTRVHIPKKKRSRLKNIDDMVPSPRFTAWEFHSYLSPLPGPCPCPCPCPVRVIEELPPPRGAPAFAYKALDNKDTLHNILLL